MSPPLPMLSVEPWRELGRRLAGMAGAISPPARRETLGVAEPKPGQLKRVLTITAIGVALVLAYRYQLVTMIDLEVYRRGAGELVHGQSLYVSPSSEHPFTYPPFAAILFVPLYFLGPIGAAVMFTLVSLTCYAVFAVVCARSLGLSWPATALGSLAGLAFEPILHTLGIGQINLVLALLIVVDCLVMPAGRRGVLLGIAVGIKLTPGIFVLYFLLKRDVPALLRCVVGFAGTVLISALVSPHDTFEFWTKLFYSPEHVGTNRFYVANQSMFGDLGRLVHNAHPPLSAYAALVVIALVLATLAARRQLRAGDELAALVCIAIGGLLISPISWSHHWVWLVPAGLVLAVHQRWWSLALILAVPIISPIPATPSPDQQQFHYSWWVLVLCMTYVAAGVWFLVVMLRASPRDRMPQSAAIGSHQRGCEPTESYAAAADHVVSR
ncbi:MAG: glycosyltransferase 87 family protein [Nocardioidaceae bacterium]